MPNSISQNLQRLIDAKDAITTAITNKGGTVASGDGFEEFYTDISTIPTATLGTKSITDNGTYNASSDGVDGYSSVSVNVPVLNTAPQKDVNFYDYDGSIVYSYTSNEFLNLTEMPANPIHDELTSQGWNWTLSDAKTYVAKYKMLEIGQMYIPTDGKTHIHIKLEEGCLHPYLGLGVNGTVDIDWGDLSEHSTLTGTNTSTTVFANHVYSSSGNYIIKLGIIGQISFTAKNGSSGEPYSNVGTLLVHTSGGSLGAYKSMCYTNAVTMINFGNNVELISSGSKYPFEIYESLNYVTFPYGMVSIPSYVFRKSYIYHVTLPNSITSIGGYAFGDTKALKTISLPNSIQELLGYSLAIECLRRITIPNSVTSTGDSAFRGLYSISSITIPDSVASIGSNAFYDLKGIGQIIFTSSTPPTVGSSAFYNVPTSCKIYVPSGSLTSYTSASGYPSSSTYTYIEY
jgi:hypothetical protein